jgi:predicted transposase YdaD
MLRCIIELTDAENVGALIKATYRSSKETGDAMTTAYEYLIKKGLKEGIDLGRQEGIDLGRQEGIDLGRQEGIDLGKKMAEKEAESKLIKTLLTAGFDEHKVASLVGTSVEDVQRVQLSLAAQA